MGSYIDIFSAQLLAHGYWEYLGVDSAPPNIAPENIIIYKPIRSSATGAILGGAKGRYSIKIFPFSTRVWTIVVKNVPIIY